MKSDKGQIKMKSNRIYLTISNTKKSVFKTTVTDNSHFNKALDTNIQTYKQATPASTPTNKPRHHREQKKQTNKYIKKSNSNNCKAITL